MDTDLMQEWILRGGRVSTRVAGIGLAAGLAGQAFEARDILAFSAGPVLIRPHLSVAEEYNDNLYYDADHTVSDWITTVTPGVVFHLGRPEAIASLDLGYNYSHLWYADNSDNESSIHQVTLGINFAKSRFSSQTVGTYSYLDTIYGGYEAFLLGDDGFTIRAVDRNISRDTLSFAEDLGYELGAKSEIHGRFTINNTDFRDKGTYYDQFIWRVLAGTGYQIRPKVHLIGDAYYGQTASDPNDPALKEPDNMSTIGGYAGARFAFTPTIGATAKVGYESSDFGDTKNIAGGDDSFSGVSADVSVDAKFSERTTATLGYRRGTGASVQSYASGYISDSVSLRVTQMVGSSVRPWRVSVSGAYGGNSYQTGPSEGTRNDYMNIGCGLSYQPKAWLLFGLDYSFSKHFASQSSVDYDVNRVSLTATVGY